MTRRGHGLEPARAAPASVIGYVAVHEFVHLIEPNHAERFRGIVSSSLREGSRSE